MVSPIFISRITEVEKEKSDTITNAFLLQSNSSASLNEADNGRAEVEARLLSPCLTASFLRSRYEQMESTS